VSCIFQIRKIQLTLIITLTLIDTVMVIIYVLSPVPVTGTQAIQPPVPAAGNVVSVCRYAKVPAAGTGGCTACVPVIGTGDRYVGRAWVGQINFLAWSDTDINK